ncbi:MAG: DUF2865 domain-containing protein [Notoacmeibacter sp.]
MVYLAIKKAILAKNGVFSLILAIVFTLPFVAPASAEEEWHCRSLRLQIDAAPKTQPSGRNSAQAARYAKAISAQEAQIGKAKSQIRALGCSASIFSAGEGSKPACGKLNTALKSMNSNMSKLKAQYARLSNGSGGTVSSREVLKARYNSAGCNDAAPVFKVKQKTEEKPKSGIVAILGDTKAKRQERSRADKKRAAETLEIPGLSFSGDTFRTLCVRKCDGYYFPISFSTTKENFKRDTVACESMCPGTEVELFMHKVPEEESEDMATAKGEKYKAMSYAFAYRREGVAADPACRCQAVQGMAVLNNSLVGNDGFAILDKKSAKASDAVETADTVPIPTPRGDLVFDRESLADAAGNLTNDDIIAVFKPQVSATNADGSIRVVGPVFLPDPSGAIELKTPVRPLLR